MSSVRTRSARARLALAACALWLGGVEVLPDLHEALHDRLAPHRHEAGGIITTSFEDTTHRHPDGTIHFVAAKPQRKPARDGRSHVGDLGHAAGLAHHAAALAPSAPPLTQPLPVDRRPIVVAIAAAVEPVVLAPRPASARGPPAIA